MTYSEKLKDQRWQKKRLQLLEAARWECQSFGCQNAKSKPTLHVHHKVYLRKVNPWDYPDWAYQVVCDDCHEVVQMQMEKSHCVLAKNEDLILALSMLSGHTDEVQSVASEAIRDACSWGSSDVVRFLFVLLHDANSAAEMSHAYAWRNCQKPSNPESNAA